jgi:hypothetical protein
MDERFRRLKKIRLRWPPPAFTGHNLSAAGVFEVGRETPLAFNSGCFKGTANWS